MKTITLTLIALMGICAGLQAATLTTADGTTYDNITMQRVDPDGLYVEYTPTGGGLGMAKVKFSRLDADQQKQYGYDAARARDYEQQCAKATEDFRQQALKWDETARATRADQLNHEMQQDKCQTDRILAMARLNEAQADLIRADNNAGIGGGGDGYAGGYSGGYGGYGGYGLIAIPPLSGAVRAGVNGGQPSALNFHGTTAAQRTAFNNRSLNQGVFAQPPFFRPAFNTSGRAQ